MPSSFLQTLLLLTGSYKYIFYFLIINVARGLETFFHHITPLFIPELADFIVIKFYSADISSPIGVITGNTIHISPADSADFFQRVVHPVDGG